MKNPVIHLCIFALLLIFLWGLTGNAGASSTPPNSSNSSASEGSGETTELPLKIFKLNHLPAEIALEYASLYLSNESRTAVDSRTNSLLVRDYPENIAKIDELLRRMDVPLPMVRIKVDLHGVTGHHQTGIQAGVSPKGKHGQVWVSPNIQSGASTVKSSLNLLVISGGSGFIKIGERAADPLWFYNYFLGRGYIKQGVVFKEVSTGFFIKPKVRGSRIEMTIAPGISYYDGKNRDRIILREMETTVIIKDGESTVLGVSDQDSQQNESFIGRIIGTHSLKENQFFTFTVSGKIVKE